MSICTGADVLALKLPMPAREAQQRAATHPALWTAKSGVVRLAQLLIAITDFDTGNKPRAELRFARARLAAPLAVSTRTIDRLLSELQVLGFIERLPQRRLRGPDGHYWDCTRARWTESALNGFFRRTTVRQRIGEPAAKHSESAASQLDIPLGETCQLSVETSATQAIGSARSPCVATGTTAALKDASTRVPVELLEWPEILGIAPKSMIWLMALCKRSGVWLQDVLQHCAQALTRPDAPRGKPALGYLRAVIASGKDFALLVRQATSSRNEQHRRTQREKALATLAPMILQPGVELPTGHTVHHSPAPTQAVLRDHLGVVSAAPAARVLKRLLEDHPQWVVEQTHRCHPQASAARALAALLGQDDPSPRMPSSERSQKPTRLSPHAAGNLRDATDSSTQARPPSASAKPCPRICASSTEARTPMESSSAPEPGPMLDPQPLDGAPTGPKARSDRQGYDKGAAALQTLKARLHCGLPDPGRCAPVRAAAALRVSSQEAELGRTARHLERVRARAQAARQPVVPQGRECVEAHTPPAAALWISTDLAGGA